MPGITGLFAEDAAASLRRMQEKLYRSPFVRREAVSRDDFACLVLTTSGSAGICERDGMCLVFEGYIFNSEKRGATLREWLLERFMARGADFVDELNGSFQMAIHGRGVTYLFADHTASRRLFYSYGERRFYFSPEVAPIAEMTGALEIDGANVVQFLIAGRFFAGQTPLARIRQLLPGEYLVCDGSGIKLRRYYRFEIPEPGAHVVADRLDEPQAIEMLKEGLERAVISRWRQADRPTVLLSGGYDSRYIFHVLVRHLDDTTKLRTIFWGDNLERHGSDAEIARRLARRFGIKPIFIPRLAEHVPDHFEEAFQAQSGMLELAFGHADEVPICRMLAETYDIGSVFRGDECFGFYGDAAETRDEALASLSMYFAERVEDSGRWFEEDAREWMAAHTSRMENLLSQAPRAPQSLRDTLYCRERLPAFHHHLSYHKSHFMEVLNPLLDAEVLRLWSSLPDAHRVDKYLFKKCYHTEFKEHLDIPFAHQGNMINWRRVIARSKPVADYLRHGLETLPAPLNREFFLEKLDEVRRRAPEAAPAGADGTARIAPEQLVMRAFVLGHALRQTV
ncbi:MAG TPA: asparagine synthase-related protein [Pyrinomonadaceae bacterium]|nr:asparagine synthase-related protein [Pyrinomonadaceae bacterium]